MEDDKLKRMDISARQSFGLKVKIDGFGWEGETYTVKGVQGGLVFFDYTNKETDGTIPVYEAMYMVTPYLKRLETIDVGDYHKYLQENGYPIHSESVNIKCKDKWITYKDETPFFDYCLMNHYDYRGLIDKGLAIEVTEENNPYKKD